MANLLQQAGAAGEPTSFAPLHTNRIFTGLWTNRSQLRDAATSEYQEKYGMSRQDSILAGQNAEITPRLTLRRRCGNTIYNNQSFPPVNRFYSFNTFTLTTEFIKVLADTGMGGGQVFDATGPNTKNVLFTKSAGAGSTYFLGVGNTLYFTNGVDNMLWHYDTGNVWTWGITAPTTAPTAVQQPRPNPYPSWAASTIQAAWVPRPDVPTVFWNYVVIRGSDSNLHSWGHFALAGDPAMTGHLGSGEPNWPVSSLDGTISWTNRGAGAWVSGFGYGLGDLVIGHITNPPGTPDQLFVAIHGGTANGSGTAPNWGAASKVNMQISDGTNGLIWQNVGRVLSWTDIATLAGNPSGVSNNITTAPTILDPNGYLQTVYQLGTTSPSAPSVFENQIGALTGDALVIWQNKGPYSVPSTAPVSYGYAFKNPTTGDISNMSPTSIPITVIQGNEVLVQGDGSTQPGVTQVVIYRTPQGGSTFLYLDTIPNPAPGVKWSYLDHTPDSGLNPAIQAQRAGEGTPLPAGATCLGYHLGRIFAAVGNVVYVSSGPDAIVSGSSGNSGFNTTFTAQSKITRFWVCTLGLVVFTVRDAYIILGSATSSDPLYMVVFVEQLPLLHYDAFTINKTTPLLMQGNNMVIALDPSAGIIEVGFPIADRFEEEFDPALAFVTFHTQSSRETALYVANGNGYWYRMNSNNAPEQGSAWSPRANIAGMGCVQSVEVLPGKFLLLWAGTAAGPIMKRDITSRLDNGTPYPVSSRFGSIVLAQPGQLAALSFITLEAVRVGTRASLALLLGEISGEFAGVVSEAFEPLDRTRQDPTNLPPSKTLYSDRYHFAQSQSAAWCRHFQMEISWPAEDAANELLTFTIFGQTWQEMRSQ
jgi:hypothetical protein